MSRLRAWACAFVPGVHPGLDALVLRCEGLRCWPVEFHLERCAGCLETARRVQISEQAGGLAPHETLAHLQLSMRAWRSLAGLSFGGRTGQGRAAGSGRTLLQAVKLYFGEEAARRLEHSAPVNSVHLLPATKQLFATFLGRKAADALASRIRRTAT
jgi:hypothetical protein